MTPISIFSSSGVLAVVVAAILLIGHLARRSPFLQRRGQATARLGLVETLSLDSKRRLLLVRCDGRHVLVLAGQTDQVIGWLPEHAA